MRYQHLGCYMQWHSGKICEQTEQNSTVSLKLKKLECDVCKLEIPRSFIVNKQKQEIFSLDKPKQMPYLILERLAPVDELGRRACHLVKLPDSYRKSVLLGRSADSCVKIDEVSVSRFHVNLEFVDNKLCLRDDKSRFGTSVLIEGEHELKETLRVQIANTVFLISPIFEPNIGNKDELTNLVNDAREAIKLTLGEKNYGSIANFIGPDLNCYLDLNDNDLFLPRVDEGGLDNQSLIGLPQQFREKHDQVNPCRKLYPDKSFRDLLDELLA
eukprot:TRINITY_DN9160_c0_g2_i2.p1 TRINITY_DN9160_c0_g2~~TRINITY_DN9160_c0_g2_i2.p1  ORF type:complete len:271 (+),score=32.40 TRINITY_DN9160_c0_g2_i2:112-924(+)